jgi:hypothetical protein
MEECGFAHDCGGLCFPRREPPRRRLHTRRVLRHHEPRSQIRAATCASCGWVTYPRAEPVSGTPLKVNWIVPPVCSRCGSQTLPPTANLTAS